jgi:hypothetical protein
MKLNILCLSLLIITVTFIHSQNCPAGYYYLGQVPHWADPCAQCGPGSYCPGDDSEHACVGNTYTDTPGATECKGCPNMASPTHTFCLFPDTPSSVKYLNATSHLNILALQTGYYVSELDFTYESKQQVVSLRSSNSVPMTVYVSRTTGAPSKSNHEFALNGAAVSFAFNRHEKQDLIGYYIRIELANPNNVITINEPVDLARQVATVDTPLKFKVRSGAFSSLGYFVIPDIQKESAINVTINPNTRCNSVDLELYAGADGKMQYPTNLTADIIKKYSDHKVNIYLPKVQPGEVYFGFQVDTSCGTEVEFVVTTIITAPNKL